MSSLDVRAAADRAPHRVALYTPARTWTFRDLVDEVDARYERLVAAGYASGERVLVTPRVDADDVLTLFMLLDRDIPLVLAHPRWTIAERARVASTTRATIAFDQGIWERITEPASAGEPGEVLFATSGTSGTPQIIVQSTHAVRAAADAHATVLPPRDDDVWELALPLAHVGGLSILARALAMQAGVAIPGSASPTLLSLVPTALRERIERTTPDRLRAVLVGGAALDPSLLARARSKGFACLPTYGMTETCGQVATQRLGEARAHGVGPPLPGWTLRFDLDGAISVRGPSLLRGRLDARGHVLHALDPDGFFRTGDRGHLDAEGHLSVDGRLDDTIVTGGENVDPREVENAIRMHPAVEDAIVVGLADPRWGQVVTALVAGGLSQHTLTTHLRASLAGFKIPKEIVFVDQVPLLANGKPDREGARRLIRRSAAEADETLRRADDPDTAGGSAAGAGARDRTDRSADRGR